MAHETGPDKSHRGINQTILIALISAGATILAALLPTIVNNANKNAPPTWTPFPTLSAPTNTPLPEATLTPTEEGKPTATKKFTATPIPPTATATKPLGIYDVYLAEDKNGQYKTNTFGPQQTVYIFFKVNDPSGASRVGVVWYAVDVQGFSSNTPIHTEEEQVIRQEPYFEMFFSPKWKTGKYKVELYLNGSLASTQLFEIK